ncbi:MAG: DUF11 domain-containing protein [Nitrosomonadales bacterium]|nr:DUF11 domain-containing protein [Nitrosomonadales bacterium]
MNIAHRIRRYVLLTGASALLCGAQLAHADSVGQVQTTKYFAPETVAMIKQRVQDVANGVPGATLGFKQGDTVSYIIQFTPIANNSDIGAGGYITDYIPAGAQVAGAWFVQPDGMGGFYQTSPPAPAQMANGFGNGGAGTYTATWTSDPYTIATCTAAGRTLANCTGNLAQLYADTGLFYSTDPRTQLFIDPSIDGRALQWSAPTGNGYYICPARGAQLVPLMGGLVSTCAAGGVSTHNLWDAGMTNGFGTTAASITALNALLPSAGVPAIDTNGSGVPPFNAGSPVAGPDSGYQLDYTGTVGPWQRISYPGSMVGSNAFVPTTNPATVAGTNTVLATPTMSGATFPLPPNTNAVRWAAGRLVVGTQSYVKISLLMTSPPPANGLVNNSEVFGGDTSPESSFGIGGGALGVGNRDSAWVYNVPSVASNVSTLYILKEVVCVYDATGTCMPNNGANLPTTGTPGPGPKVRYRISYINTNNGTQHNVTICDQLPNTLTPVNFATGVTAVSTNPNIGPPSSPAIAACGFGAGGTTFNYPTIPVISGGGAGILEFDVQFPLLTAGSTIVNTAKAVSTEIPAGVTSYTPSNVVTSLAANLLINKIVSPSTPNKGETVTYTVTVSNTGSTAASLATLVDVLPGRATAVLASQAPSRFNYLATSNVSVNGTPLSGVVATMTPPAAPATTNSETVTWTFPSGTTIPAGGQLAVTFTATAGDATANNLMLYNTAYRNTATINCAVACVLTPVAPNTATSKTTGLTATATLTPPSLQLAKTIDCVFDALGVCTPGSYAPPAAIPTNAKLRYKIVYTNPQAYAQTITLTDTLPASTTAAGNLYVESGPEIRPSAPVMSVNPAAAGAPRDPDALLTATAGGTLVTLAPTVLPGGSSGTLYLDVQTNAAAAAVVTNTASINSAERVAAAGAAITSAVSATATAVRVTKTASNTVIDAAGNVNYTITVANDGAAAVTFNRVEDILPLVAAPGTVTCGATTAACQALTVATLNGAPVAAPLPTYSAAARRYRWTFAAPNNSILPGQTFTLTFTATYTGVAPGTYLNTGRARIGGVTTSTPATAPVTVPPNTISVSKAVVTPSPANITPNSPVTYAITVTNTGAQPAPVTSVVDSLPAAAVGTIGYTSTASVLVNGVAQTGVAGAPAAGQYQNPAPAAPVAGAQQAVTWTFPAATTINPGQTMVITFVAQFGAVPTGQIYYNDVKANYTGGATASEIANDLAPVNVPAMSRITKTIDCVYNPTCTPGSYVDGTPIPVNAKLGYKIVYENLSASAASGITITDTLPTQVGANAVSNLIVNGTPAGAPAHPAGGGTVTLLTGGTLAAGASGTITFDLQTTATAGAGVTNTATMTTTQDPLGATGSTTAAAAGGNLSVSKAVTNGTSSTVAQGGTVSYTLSVTNTGSADATLTSLVDTLPGVANAAGATWRFAYAATGAMTLNGATVTPAYTPTVTPPAAPATLNKETVTWTFTGGVVIPAGQTFKLTFTATVGTLVPKGAADPGATYYNDVTANYTGGAFPSSTANGQAPVLVPFNTLTMSKSIDCVYDAALTTCQPYVVNTPLPPNAKLRYKLLYGNLSQAAQIVTLNDTLPASTTAAGNLYVGSGPDVRPSVPALSQNPAAAGAARGADAALTAIAGGTAVAMTAASLPGSSSGTLYIDVQTNAPSGGSVINCASISTVATDTCATPGVVKSTATASVQNVAILNIGKTTSTANVAPGGTATYTITVTNTGTAATTALKVYDFLPYNGTAVNGAKRLNYSATTAYTVNGTPTALTPAITTSVAPTVPPYASNLNQQQVQWDFGAYALAAGSSLTITFNATIGADMPSVSYYNSVRHEYTSAGINFSGNVDNNALITINSAQPSLTFLKTVDVYSDPVNDTTNPKLIPGAIATYTLTVTNSGTGPVDNNTLVITDPIPAEASLYVNDLGAPDSGPVIFTPGSSGLTFDPALHVEYFGGSPTPAWGYTPSPQPDGCDPLISEVRFKPQGSFAGDPTPPSPSFSLEFRVCVK